MRYGIYQAVNGGEFSRILVLPYLDEARRIIADLKRSAELYLMLHNDKHYRFELRQEAHND